jgi:hypothetical protein
MNVYKKTKYFCEEYCEGFCENFLDDIEIPLPSFLKKYSGWFQNA